MATNYKMGHEVIIHKKVIMNKEGNDVGWVPDMDKLVGDTGIIKSTRTEGGRYEVKCQKAYISWCFSEECFEKPDTAKRDNILKKINKQQTK